jgi:HTH-type transcriptional regulator/antitoxin HigA
MIKSLIKTEADYESALARIESLMGSARGTPAFDELELLSALVEIYEQAHHPIEPPDPIDAIKFRVEQAGLKPKDLVPLMGSRAKVSEILSGKRPLTLSLIRTLHEKLNIPAEILLRQPTADLAEKDVPHPEKFPWPEIASRKWLAPIFRGTAEEALQNAKELSSYLLRNLRKANIQVALYRRSVVRGARSDPYALLAWTAHLVNTARETICPVKYRKNSIDDDFMRKLVSFSFLEEGPRLARQFLLKNGVVLVIEPHLQKTYVDGAAIMLEDGTPVIGLSLRHNRLDNFWFCLCHELAHLRLHLDQNEEEVYVDDLDVQDNRRHEKEADEWAKDQLIPPEHWESVRNCQSPSDVERVAQGLHISPAIIAGRIRYERKNYKIFSRLIGQGELHPQFLST